MMRMKHFTENQVDFSLGQATKTVSLRSLRQVEQ
jgi:hypothetical protein